MGPFLVFEEEEAAAAAATWGDREGSEAAA